MHAAPARLAHEVARLKDGCLRERHLAGEHVEARTRRRHSDSWDASDVGREPGHLSRAARRVSVDQQMSRSRIDVTSVAPPEDHDLSGIARLPT